MMPDNAERVAIKRAELLIERGRLIRDQHRIANAINNGGFFPRPVNQGDSPTLLAYYEESRANTSAIKAIDVALRLIDGDDDAG